MIHKFVSNDNKGNVNVVEIGSDYTKLGKVSDPVSDTDAANKKYVDQHGGSGGVLVVHGTTVDGVTTLDKTWQEIVDEGFSVLYIHNPDVVGATFISAIVGYVVGSESSAYVVGYGYDNTFYAPSPNDYPNDVVPAGR